MNRRPRVRRDPQTIFSEFMEGKVFNGDGFGPITIKVYPIDAAHKRARIQIDSDWYRLGDLKKLRTLLYEATFTAKAINAQAKRMKNEPTIHIQTT